MDKQKNNKKKKKKKETGIVKKINCMDILSDKMLKSNIRRLVHG